MNRPLIALMVSLEDGLMAVNRTYLNAVWHSGGCAVALPYTDDEEKINQFVEEFDGFLFTGGDDIDPAYYGQEKHPKTENICSERDAFEQKMFHAAYKTGKPILGICRGEQVINVFLGGDLTQHIEGHVQTARRAVREQAVDLVENGMLHNILGQTKIYTNSFHHQVVNKLADRLICDGYSFDGYIEAYHDPEHPFLLGVQWHPEGYFDIDETSSKIFDAFVEACKTHAIQ